MNTLIGDRSLDPDGSAPDGGDTERLTRRPRRRWLNPASAAVLALVACAIGFYVGVRVEKSTVSGASTGSATGGALAAGTGAPTGSSRASAAATRSGSGAAGGFPARFGGGAAGGGNTTVGTVTSVDGKTLVLSETSGDTVQVAFTSATKISKAKSVGRDQIHPGDTIVVSGVTDGKGTISAASVTDSGASSSSRTSGSSSSGTSGSGGAGSALRSLFLSGG